MQNAQNLIWIDLEMTGLDPDNDVIIEMATIVTDSNLNTLVDYRYTRRFQAQRLGGGVVDRLDPHAEPAPCAG